MVEVHPNPDKAMSDGPQSLFPAQFEKLMRDVEALCPVVAKDLELLPQIRLRSRPVVAPDDAETTEGLTVAFQGTRGAYSEQALERYFHDHRPVSHGCKRFLDVFREVTAGKADYGIIPIENSLAGSIHENYDLLIQHPDVEIVGEVIHRVEHSLIGFEGTRPEDLEKVFSHPQGLAQCAFYLDNLSGVEQVPFYDTAGSVAHVAEAKNPRWAAIANAAAAGYYGLSVLKEGIESNPSNYTRFFVVTRWGRQTSHDPNKASLIFTLPDKAGSLFQCTRIFAEEGLNMTKLESRPQLGKPWEYMFYVDVEVERGESDKLRKGVERVGREMENFRNLGMYNRA
jgi:prephenate dehydratase